MSNPNFALPMPDWVSDVYVAIHSDGSSCVTIYESAGCIHRPDDMRVPSDVLQWLRSRKYTSKYFQSVELSIKPVDKFPICSHVKDDSKVLL